MRDGEISGTVAFAKGLVRGHAKIISNEKDIEKVQDCDILIISITSAEFIGKLRNSGALKKSGALVTEVGGLLSHVAIVAREMKKPCVIGTKIATKELKDGDVVEVDADKGIIRKLNNNIKSS